MDVGCWSVLAQQRRTFNVTSLPVLHASKSVMHHRAFPHRTSNEIEAQTAPLPRYDAYPDDNRRSLATLMSGFPCKGLFTGREDER